MPTLSIQNKIEQVLYTQGNTTVRNIQDNIARNGQNATGSASKTLFAKTDSKIGTVDLSIIGNNHIENLEKGTSPEEARRVSENQLSRYLYGWSFRKNIIFDKPKDRWWFSVSSARIEQSIGTLLYRNGGRKDVYSNEVQPLVDRISQQLDGVINDIKILS